MQYVTPGWCMQLLLLQWLILYSSLYNIIFCIIGYDYISGHLIMSLNT